LHHGGGLGVVSTLLNTVLLTHTGISLDGLNKENNQNE